MKPVTRAEILPIATFVANRRKLESEQIAVKSARRVTVGEHLTFLFENHATVWWQVQEMCRVESIVADDAVQHELDTYNALGGGPDELGATLLIEYEDPSERDRMLTLLHGLHEHVFLEVDGHRVAAVFDEGQWNERRVSSVQFLRFRFHPQARAAFFDLSIPAALGVDHPALSARAPLPGSVRGALCEDLAAGAE